MVASPSPRQGAAWLPSPTLTLIDLDMGKLEPRWTGASLPRRGSGVGRSGTGKLKVDGNVVATKRMDRSLPVILQWDESFDIGSTHIDQDE